MLVDSKKRELKDEAVLMVAAQETKSKYPAATVFAARMGPAAGVRAGPIARGRPGPAVYR